MPRIRYSVSGRKMKISGHLNNSIPNSIISGTSCFQTSLNGGIDSNLVMINIVQDFSAISWSDFDESERVALQTAIGTESPLTMTISGSIDQEIDGQIKPYSWFNGSHPIQTINAYNDFQWGNAFQIIFGTLQELGITNPSPNSGTREMVSNINWTISYT
jgi:hypothetical protein